MRLIKTFLYKVKRSDFIKNVTTLATGTTLAQVVSVFSAPILYRIYSKEDYGTLGLYMAITGVIGVFSTLQYLEPILLESDDKEAKNVLWLNRLINAIITLIALLLVLILGENIGFWLNNELITPWLILLPVSIFFAGQNSIFKVWANRKKEYRIMSFNSVFTAVMAPLVAIVVGVFNGGIIGLLSGYLCSQVIPSFVLLISLTQKYNLGFHSLNMSLVKIKAIEYINYPKYSLPSELINKLSNQLPVFMLSMYSGPVAVGLYNLCARMLGLPLQLLGGAISEVFKQNAAQDYNYNGSIQRLFKNTLKTLAIISIIPTVIIVFWSQEIFGFVFGVEWVDSGTIAQCLVVYVMIKFIVSPLSYVIKIKDKLYVGSVSYTHLTLPTIYSV